MRTRAIPAAVLAAMTVVTLAPTATAASSPGEASPLDFAAALDVPDGTIYSARLRGAPEAAAVAGEALGTFPRTGDDYVILSTGVAADVPGGDPVDDLSTELGDARGADGNDLSQLSLTLVPPAGARCLALDYQLLSEEYPEFLDGEYNDVFTAELGRSDVTVAGDRIEAPRSFAVDPDGEIATVGTVLGFGRATDTGMDGTTVALEAHTRFVAGAEDGRFTLVLSVQDIGDSVYDTAVLLDSFRWLYGDMCAATPLERSPGGSGLDLFMPFQIVE
ncbi:choice-of-anchor L domain-containing protein [Demequina pelophila]|uniref:choice-of-anchor L domain-containing protein n=1 Tax=Demequina pelophila TaxID=1638984 RepID=UPI000785B465|nr:choice-of-anchor L domain-containing protein [Demequina pelophila]